MKIDFGHMLDALVEHDDNPAPPAPAVAKPPAPPSPVPYNGTPASEGAPAGQQDDAYQQLAAKTDFNATPVFQVIQKYLGPLASIPTMDDRTKFKTALVQAQAIERLDPQSVVNVFDEFKQVLDSELQKFNDFVAQATANRVEAKKAQAAGIATQIQQLQAQQQQLSDEAFAAQQSIQFASHRFEQAHRTRQTELTAEQNRYAALLA